MISHYSFLIIHYLKIITYNLLLLSTSDDKLGTLSTLESHLLLLNSLVEIRSESQVSDGHIIELDVVLIGTLLEKLTNTLGNLLSLRQKLLSVVLGNHSLHDLVSERGKHTITVVGTDLTVDEGQVLFVGMSQNSKGNTDSLQILGTSLGRDLTRSGTDVVDVRVLQNQQ